MKRKTNILLLLMIVFLLSGCKAEVDVNISQHNIKNEIKIHLNQEENQMNNKRFRNYYPAYYDDGVGDEEPDEEIEFVDYFKVAKTPVGSGMLYNYSYNYPFGKYVYSMPLITVFPDNKFTIDNNSNSVAIHLNSIEDKEGNLSPLGIFDNYSELEELKINVRTELTVLSANADSINNGVYTWVFTREDREKKIDLVLDLGNSEVEINTTKALTYGDLTVVTTTKAENKKKEEKGGSTVAGILAPIFLSIIALLMVFAIASIIKKKMS